MEKLGLLRVENRRLTDEFGRFFIGAQIAAFAGVLNLIFFGDNLSSQENILFFRFDLILFASGALITSLLFILLNKGQYLRAITAFLWLWSIIMAFTTWFEGGLFSSIILSFPIIFMFAALFSERAVFLSICCFLSVAIIFMGLNHSYHWLLPPEGMEIIGIPRFLSILVLTILSGYVCWILGELLKKSFADLEQENNRVINSQSVINKLAASDAVTGLLNRHGAETSYQDLLARTNFNNEHIVGYFIDLDNFKSINDLFDHEVGDKLLITMSGRLSEVLRDDGFICRFGGDEFVLVLQADRHFDTEDFATKLLKAIARPHLIFGTEAEITASIGIATISNTETSFMGLCKKADMAMYKAKHSGKNKYHQYSDELQRQYMRNLNILSCLKGALSNNLLDLYFQPKIDLQDNKIEGAEALLRWNRGNSDGIEPDEFIPIIESTELIHSIGAWVINEACTTCKGWHDSGRKIKVAVNVSPLQLTRSGFYEIVVDALESSGLPPDFFEIEITEHSLLLEVPLVAKQLAALKNLGVGLAIDDFGTGYSNMGYLTRLQIDTLKLDRSFVSRIGWSEEHRVIVVAVIEMAKILGMKVVAEGIETESERETLIHMGCDVGQGYLWSRAVAGSEILGLNETYSINSPMEI